MKIEPFNGYKGKLYKMLVGIPEPLLRTDINLAIVSVRNIPIEEALKTRSVSFKETAIVIKKWIGLDEV